jgi:hypothetical protein
LLWARSLLRERSHDRPADADPRRRFSPAGGAFTLYAPTSDASLGRLRAPPSQLLLPDQLPPRARLATRTSVSPEDLGPPFPPPRLEGDGRETRSA